MRLITVLLMAAFMTAACAGDKDASGQAKAGDEPKSGGQKQDVGQAFEARFPDAKVNSVSKTPMAGVYELVVDGNQVVYTDEKAEYLLLGEMVDAKARKNLTREKIEALMAIRFDTLPLQNAIKLVKGNGSRKLAVFSDPDCPFCRKLEPELAKLDNVTIYIFPYPLPMHTDAGRKSKLVWCSKDQARAWEDLMLRGKLPEKGKTDCANPVDDNIALGQKLRIDGTPALVFANGKRVPGYLPAAQIEQLLGAAGK